ncbi:hypothetical protein FA048_14095 [Pedobacter polaris]|uniref:Uncharacterized protein n=1 Tax=Pedobacter polaris TaxID=2571273 RepID=A0A4U1CNK3_9SPHI|nr:toxin-antitoxin system YwqK family antitoxin [Pedobacter polaris]TKC08283.1 hypothetical protein FA048_14095 [Pedobacter polaris]
MKKTILIAVLLAFTLLNAFGQASNDKIIYIVDSIAVIEDPEEGNEISQNDIADLVVVKDKEKLKRLGYEQFDSAIYLFTKEYRNRPDSIKMIPSSKQMERKDGVWHFHGAAFNGRIIDYYYSGKKQGEGTFLNGKINGYRVLYFQNGKISTERTYKSGIAHGFEKEFYEDGSIKQKGEFVDGKENGIWESYFPNGQVKLRSNYDKGEIKGNAIKYYSNGKIKESVFIKNGKVTEDPKLEKLTQLMTRSNESNKEGDLKSAIKYCSKVLELDSTYAEAYFSRGTIKLNDFQFDEAIADFDKALQLEPFMEFALANRAFARIRKYQFGNSRTLSQSKDITILASKEKVSIPEAEQAKICNDLKKSIFLGNKIKMITEALTEYCQAL